jgi:Immunity protein 26
MARDKGINYSHGDIVAIPLLNGNYAFAKILQGSDFAVYDFVSQEIESVESIVRHPIAFYENGVDKAVKNGNWAIVGHEQFETLDAEWAPPRATFYLRETNEWTMRKTPYVYVRGENRVATHEETKGLDIFGVANRPEAMVLVIMDRLVHGNHTDYKVVG